MESDLQFIGSVDNNSKLLIPNTQNFDGFCSGHKNKKVIISIQVCEPNSSQYQIGYIKGYMVSTVQKLMNDLGNRYTKDETLDFLMSASPATSDLGSDETLESQSMQCLTAFIEDVMRFCSMELNYILDSK